MGAIEPIQALLGGEATTGPLTSERDVMRLARRGLPTKAVDHFLQASQLSFNALDPRILNRRTFKRRRSRINRSTPPHPTESCGW